MRTIRFHLIALIAASVLPILVFAAIVTILFERQQRSALERSFRDTARSLTLAVDQELAASISSLRVLATSEHLAARNLERFYDQASRALKTQPSWVTVALYDRSGQQVLNPLRPFGTPPPASPAPDVVTRTFAAAQPVVSSLFEGPVVNAPIVAVTVPVIHNGAITYALGAGLRLSALTELLAASRLPDRWLATLIDQNGRIVARTRGIDALLGQPAGPELVRQSRVAEESSFRYVTRDGVSVYAAHSRSRLSGWTLSLGVPVPVVEAPGRASFIALVGGGAALLLLAAGLSLLLGKRIALGIRSLSVNARALEHGDAVPRARQSGILEIAAAERELADSARARAEAEERTGRIVAHALDAVITIDTEGRVLSWNPQAERVFGWAAADAVDRTLSELIIPAGQREAHEHGLARFRETGAGPILGRRIEVTARRRDGTEFPVELAITPMRLEGTTVFSAFVRDITERKQAEASLTRYAERLGVLHDIDRAIIAAETPAAIAETALWRLRDLLGVPRAIANLFDLEAGEVEWLAAVGRRRSRIGPGVRYPLRLAGDLEALRRGEPQIVAVSSLPPSPEVEALRASDVRVYMVVPMLTRGELIGAISFGGPTAAFPAEQVSIAQEVAAQLAIAIEHARLRERVTTAERQYHEIFENAVEGMFRSTPTGRYLLVNPALARLYGYASSEEMIASIDDIARDLYVDHEERQTTMRQLEAHGAISRVDTRARRKDGTVIWVSQSVRAVRDSAGQLLYYEGNIEDITERKRAEEARRESEASFRLLFASNPLPMWVYDVATLYFLEVNDAAIDHYGYAREEFLRMRITDIRPPEDVPRLQDAVAEIVRGVGEPVRRHERSWRHRLKDGRERDVDIVSHAIDFGGQRAMLVVAIDVTEVKEAEERVKRQAAELEERVEERTRALSAANAEADRANRAKSEFLSRMSHELRTPLNGIIGFGQLLELDALTLEQRESVDHILKGGRHLLTLINEVLDIARIESDTLSISLEPVLANDVVRSAVDLVRPQAAARRVTLSETVPDERYVLADRQRLQQVLLNLLSNAVKYNRDGGSVAVAWAETATDRVRIAVRDTGRGIAPAMRERLFTPFDRLGAEEAGIEGTGLGLALSKRLVEAMNGALFVESSDGEGTTFIVEVPRAEPPADPGAIVEDGGADRSAPNTRGTVLYIEDNLANLRLFERIVARRPGLTLLSAMQGRRGLELAHDHRPDAIILDLHLPDLPGSAVLGRLREDPQTREIPVVILSADATQGQISRLLAQGAVAYLTKPLDVSELLRLLDNLLDPKKR